MAVTKFIEAGFSATFSSLFYTNTTGTVASATDHPVAMTGGRSLKCSSGAGNATAGARKTGIMADAGRRGSFSFIIDTIPTTMANIFMITQSGGTNVFRIRLNTNGKLQFEGIGATAVNGTTVLAVNTRYRISFGYTLTNTTTYRFDVYVDGVSQGSATAGTLTNTTSDRIYVGFSSAPGANINAWYGDIYIDDGTDYADVGDIRVTAKRPNANGTTNGFTTQIGSGGSGYGSGHSPQVNERALFTPNGWSIIGAGSAVTEEYNIESAATGDVDISAATIRDYTGWVYAKALASETGQIIVNGASSNISLVSSDTLFTKIAGSTTYPAGTGTDIGIVTDTTLTTVSLYEAGVMVAYTEAVAGSTTPLRMLMGMGT